MAKITLLVMSLFFTWIGESLAADAMTLETLLSRHEQALGGASTVRTLQNVRIEIEIQEPGMMLRGDYRASKDGWVRIDVYDGEERVFSEGIDSAGGWQQFGAGTTIEAMSEEGLLAMRRGIDNNLFGLVDAEARGHKLALIGTESHRGVDYFKLDFQMADGFERHYLINPQTWLIDFARETSALHPDIDATEQAVESHYTDYSLACGMTRNYNTATLALATGEEIQSSSIKRVQCDLSEPALQIDRPLE